MNNFGIGTPEQFAGFVHAHNSKIIAAFDTKVAIFFGICSGALVYVIRDFNLLHNVQLILSGDLKAVISFQILFALVATVFLSISFLACIFCLMPRYGKAQPGYIFFKSMLRYKKDTYIDEVLKATEADLIHNVLLDAHSLARIAQKKSFYVGVATLFLALGLPFMIAAFAFTAL